MDKNQEFLLILKDFNCLQELLKEKAWDITPNSLRELLIGEFGFYGQNDKEPAMRWLIKPRWQFNDKSAAEMICEGKSDVVEKLLNALISGTYL